MLLFIRRVASPSSDYSTGPKIKRSYNLRRKPRTAGPVDSVGTFSSLHDPGPSHEDNPLDLVHFPPLEQADRASMDFEPLPLRSNSQDQRSMNDQPVVFRQFLCPDCDRSFSTKIGLGVHRRRAHPDESNAAINVSRTRRQWSAEELRLMAREEAIAVIRGDVRYMNQHLLSVLSGGRTLEAIKGARRGQGYKVLVAAAIQDLNAVPEAVGAMPVADDDVSNSSSSFHYVGDDFTGSTDSGFRRPLSPSHRSSCSHRWSLIYSDFNSAIRRLLPIVDCIRGFRSDELIQIAHNFLNGADISRDCCAWLHSVFPTPPICRSRSSTHRVFNTSRLSRKRQRRREYARIQKLFAGNMSRASKEILDGSIEAKCPDVTTMAAHWGSFVSQKSAPSSLCQPADELPAFKFVWHPVTCEDTAAVTITMSSAPGIDGITARQWRAVPASVKALFFNIVLASGGFPSELLVSRTIFLPKKSICQTPADFRPISIASVTIRHLHKILSQRLRETRLVDLRQRCLDDGCAENVAVLAALLDDSRRCLRELHICSLDVAKAFDSVSHNAIANILGGIGLPKGFVDYIARLYSNSYTMFEVDGLRSDPFRVNRGVRQGDPLSSIIFCLVADQILRAVPRDVGYEMDEYRINAFAYADDIILVASTKSGMMTSLRHVEQQAQLQGLSLNASKCVALSIVPAGKQKKYKVLAETQFHLADGSPVTQLTPSSEWRYLGVDFRPIGPKRAGSTLTTELDRVTRAPLKPQQRVKILRCFLIPRYYHVLVLSGTTLGKLRALDRQVRDALRRWLRLPHDSPIGYFHTSCSMGGLGIPSFATTVPGLMLERLERMAQSSSPVVRAIVESAWITKRIAWARRALTVDGFTLDNAEKRKKWWAGRLYSSIDGKELRESGMSILSTWWIDSGCYGIPGRDYVQYHHVRVNALPTRIRTSRGLRRVTRDIRCRAGCSVTETAAHVIQVCHRTHGGRVKRHNAVCRTLASGLRDVGWNVREEPRYTTTSGIRKPDLVVKKDDQVSVIDAQVVSGAISLDDSHERKRSYYADNCDLRRQIVADYGVCSDNVSFSSCTISWRGIWSSKSADYLISLGLSKKLLAGITTRVLQGSHTNWVRWNRQTSMQQQRSTTQIYPRTGIG